MGNDRRRGVHHRAFRTGSSRATVAIAVVLAVVPVLLPAQTDDAASEEDLFSSVFGGSALQELLVPVIRDGRYVGELRTEIDGAVVRVDGPALEMLLADALNAASRRDLSEAVAGADLVELGTTTVAGVYLSYNATRVELALDIAPAARAVRTVGAGNEPGEVTPLDPLEASLVANGSFRFDFDRGATPSATAILDIFSNLEGLVFETRTTLNSAGVTDPDLAWITLNEARMVWDGVEEQLRGDVGLVDYRTARLFGAPEIVGVSVTRREELDRTRPFGVEPSARFVAQEAARVTAMLNGRPFRTIEAVPSPYRVDDLPLGRGVNRVSFDVPADGGAVLVLAQEDIPYSPDLLGVGRHWYSYAAGLLRDGDAVPALAAYHRIGVLPQWTLGATVQATAPRSALGLESLSVSDFGVTAVNGGVSFDAALGAGFAADVSHVVSVLYVPRAPAVEFSFGYRSPAWLRLGATAESASPQLRAGISYRQRFDGGLSVAASAAQDFAVAGAIARTTLRASANGQLSDGLNITAQLEPTFSQGGVSWQGSVFLRFRFGTSGTISTVSYDPVNGPAQMSFANVPQSSIGSVAYSLNVSGIDRTGGTPQRLSGTVDYAGRLGRVALDPRVGRTIGADLFDFGTTVRVDGALVLGGGVLRVTRPVTDSFAVLVPRAVLGDNPVPVRTPGGGVIDVVAGAPAVIPNLGSYGRTTVRLDNSLLPDGLSVGEPSITFEPGYRQAYRVVVGSASAVYAVGQLVDDINRPIALQAGEVVDSNGTATLFFTDEEGRFELLELAPGEYRLFLFADPEAETVLSVPPDAVGRYDLGPVVFLGEWR